MDFLFLILFSNFRLKQYPSKVKTRAFALDLFRWSSHRSEPLK